jgi:hypothetical protein
MIYMFLVYSSILCFYFFPAIQFFGCRDNEGLAWLRSPLHSANEIVFITGNSVEIMHAIFNEPFIQVRRNPKVESSILEIVRFLRFEIRCFFLGFLRVFQHYLTSQKWDSQHQIKNLWRIPGFSNRVIARLFDISSSQHEIRKEAKKSNLRFRDFNCYNNGLWQKVLTSLMVVFFTFQKKKDCYRFVTVFCYNSTLFIIILCYACMPLHKKTFRQFRQDFKHIWG